MAEAITRAQGRNLGFCYFTILRKYILKKDKSKHDSFTVSDSSSIPSPYDSVPETADL